MRKIILTGLLGALLVACKGVETSSSSVSSNSNSLSSVKSSSSNSGTSSSSGNASNGAMVFATHCSTCHKDTNGDGYFGVGSDSGDVGGVGLIDPDDLGTPASSNYPTYKATSLQNVADFIEQYMGTAGNCDAQCAIETATYLWSLKDGVAGPEGTAVSCSNPSGIHYGKRVLHFLTSYEYNNSLQQLFGAPLPDDYSKPAKAGQDNSVARLPNHALDQVDETRLNTYYDNAVELADWAMSTPGALPFDCEDPVACASDFITEFAYVAYRRALTDTEQKDISAIFTGAPDVNTGLKWALRTVLMSPQFLYRTEIGTKVSVLRQNPVVAPGTQYSFQGTPSVYQNLTIDRYNRISVASDSSAARYKFTGNDLIAISVRGKKSEFGNWPILTVGIGYSNEGVIKQITINHTSYRTYYFTIDSLPNAPLYFLNDASAANNDYQMPPLEVASLTAGVLGTSEPVQDDVAKLAAADQNAYVLDPYEYASALSFALTGSGPSKSLLDAAVAGELVDRSSREKHVDALIDSALGKAQVERLGGLWFGTDRLNNETRNDAEFTQAVRDSMMQEMREIYKHVFYNGDFPSMYEGDFTYLNSTLSQFYGMAGGGSSPNDFRMVNTAGTDRGGVIASGAYMALNAHMDYTSPIKRSAHFRQDALCQTIPLPTNLEDSAERAAAAELVKSRVEAGNITTTDFYDLQTNIAGSSCATCHNAIINPLFGMDDFDNVGRLRPRLNGDAVQDGLLFVNMVAVPKGDKNLSIAQVNQGSYLYSYDVVGALSGAMADAAKNSGDGLYFSGAKELGKAIVENDVPGVSACLIEKTSRFALGYSLRKDFLQPAENGYYGISNAQASEFACIQDELEAAYAAAKSPRDVLKTMVMSDSFRFRK